MANDLSIHTNAIIEWVNSLYPSQTGIANDSIITSPASWDIEIEVIPINRSTQELGVTAIWTQIGILRIAAVDAQPVLETWNITELLNLLQIAVNGIENGNRVDTENGVNFLIVNEKINSNGIRFSRSIVFQKVQVDAALEYSISVEFSYEADKVDEEQIVPVIPVPVPVDRETMFWDDGTEMEWSNNIEMEWNKQ